MACSLPPDPMSPSRPRSQPPVPTQVVEHDLLDDADAALLVALRERLASDKLVLDGVTLDDGDKATNTSTTGDIIVLTYYSADGWYAASDGWTDTGA